MRGGERRSEQEKEQANPERINTKMTGNLQEIPLRPWNRKIPRLFKIVNNKMQHGDDEADKSGSVKGSLTTYTAPITDKRNIESRIIIGKYHTGKQGERLDR